MSKSSQLRAADGRGIINLVGECRELGDDWTSWQTHWILGLATLTDADLGFTGEAEGTRKLAPRSVRHIYRGQPGYAVDQVGIDALFAEFADDPGLSESLIMYFQRTMNDNGACLSEWDLYNRREWEASHDYQLIGSVYRSDPTLWCFRALPRATADESLGVSLVREKGRRRFLPRHTTIVREAVAALVPLIGGPLIRAVDPSPRDLAPRARQVLACLLEGDGDKQVAARLKLSTHTVNQYTKGIFHHFGVRSRTELLARWIRRGRGQAFPWVE